MKILMAAGGTAGHINPAVAMADYIMGQNPQAEIIFAGTPGGMEAKLVPQAGYRFVPIKVHGFQRSFSPKNVLRNISAVYRLFTSAIDAGQIFKTYQPDLVLGTGGYVSGPILRKAAQLGIPSAIHEQNAFPGVTNKILSRYVDLIFLAVEEAKKCFPSDVKTVVVGNPVRHKILYTSKKEARKKLKMDDHFCILSFGGSLGASIINQIAADLIGWHAKEQKINHIHATGKAGANAFFNRLAEKKVDLSCYERIDVREYIDNMDLCMAAADLIICRSGALTLSELEAAGKPSILVPSPYVAENHQYYNAMVLQNHRAAIVVEEKNYQKEQMIQMVKEFSENPSLCKEYSKNASSLAVLDTCERMYNHLLQLLMKNDTKAHTS